MRVYIFCLLLSLTLPSSPLIFFKGWGWKGGEKSRSGKQLEPLDSYNSQERKIKISNLSFQQIMEFKQLGKYQLEQIRSQLDTEFWKKNTDMNIKYQLQKFGILRSDKTDRSDNNTRCYHEIGCIEISERWYGLTRPVNLLPLDREVINTQFILRTQDNLQERIINVSDPKSLTEAGMNGSKPLKLIIHGFIDTGFEVWVKDLSEALLDVLDCNVVSVDWGGGSLPLYSQAAANTRVVGLEVAFFINKLIEDHGLTAENVHIIGHSLGAHIAGYAGEQVQGMGRISGLDPAEPLFQGMPEFVILDPSDALFVDVIHTDAKSIIMGGYGMKQAVGDIDFYPNGGEFQPGCSILSFPMLSSITVEDMDLPTPESVSRHLVACAHNRAVQLYIDSIRRGRTCTMIGHLCSSYEEYQDGNCLQCGEDGERCSVLGYHSSKHSAWKKGDARTMYLDTAGTSPFCRHNYVLELELGRSRDIEDWVQGELIINLYGDRGEIIKHRLTPEEESIQFFHGKKKEFKLSLQKNIGVVSIAEVYWEYDHEIDPFDLGKMCFMFCSDKLFLENIAITSFIIDKSMNVRSERRVLCGEDEELKPLESGKWELFYKNCQPR